LFAGQGNYEVTPIQEYVRFGRGVIQPTIWTTGSYADGQVVHALCRNFGNRKYYSQYYQTETYKNGTVHEGPFCKVWAHAGDSGFYNVNNSIHVISWGADEIALWNDSRSPNRVKMTIGNIVWQAGTPRPIWLEIVGEAYGAYPSLACDDRFLYFSFTNAKREIEYHVWNKKRYRKAIEAARTTRGGRDLTGAGGTASYRYRHKAT
jgi:hypothetical protein